jgi:SWIM/SEC-C metal-binding protein
MAKLGTHARPAVVRVQTQDRADELLEICEQNEWQVIVGVEPDQPEDITDVSKLLHPERFTVQNTAPSVGRNDPCTCGSGRKYKHCCLRSPKPPSAP